MFYYDLTPLQMVVKYAKIMLEVTVLQITGMEGIQLCVANVRVHVHERVHVYVHGEQYYYISYYAL